MSATWSFLWVCLLLLTAHLATAQEAGRIVSIVGEAEVFRAGQWQPATLRQELLPGDMLRTARGSRVAFLLVDGSQIKVNANSTLELKQMAPSPGRPVPAALGLLQTILNLFRGEIWLRSHGEPLEIQTPAATATIRGTEFNLAIAPAEVSRLAVLEGAAVFSNPQGSVLVAAGEQALAQLGEAPRKTVLVRPLDAVQWSLYYPGIVSFRDYPLTDVAPRLLPEKLVEAERRVASAPQDVEARVTLGEVLFDLGRRTEAQGEFTRALLITPQEPRARAGLGWVQFVAGNIEEALREFRQARPPPLSALMGESLALYQLERFEAAAAVIAEANRRFPTAPQPPTQLALLQLVQGRATEAIAALEQTLVRHPHHALAYGLLSNIYLVQNKKTLALQAAQQAVAANPSSPSAHLDLSLAQQATFQLEAALQAARKAVELDPEYPQALIQVSRLLFSLERLSAAFQMAAQAHRRAPQDPLINTTLGFLLLAQGKVHQAIAAFEQAIQADSTRGEPHLGRGLALFRQGKQEEALQAMRMATLLEPQVSLFQSYLAKALFAAHRTQEARAALERAKALDPQDPTPFYYAGIYLADENRPGAAIREFQRSIALNDNRAIFRSRFLLDQDAAARGADLARPYRLLGLDHLAESLAMDALEDDPASSSAHAFLAALARGSRPGTTVSNDEFIQAFLLSPVNANALHTLNRSVSLSPVGTRGSKGDYTVTGFTDLISRGSTSDRLRRDSGKGLANFATSFGEYTSLLEAPGGTMSAQGAYESHDTVDGSILASGGTPGLAASLFAERFSTDGFRDINNDVTAYEINGLLKFALDPQSSLSFAAVYSQVKTGDVFLNTNAFVDNDPDLRVRQELVNFHLGYHRQFAPGSHLLALAQGGLSPARINDMAQVTASAEDICPTCQAILDVSNEIRSRPYFFDMQLQQQQRLGKHRLLVGGGFLRIEERLTVEDFFPGQTVEVIGLPIVITIDPLRLPKKEASPQRSFASLYIQDLWAITPKWHLTAALHYDYAEDTRVDLSRIGLPRTNFRTSEVSPRFGLTFRPNPRHTFRLAALKFMQAPKGIGVLPSLAPTQVAGVILNQASSIFFTSARVWQYQASWEFRPTPTTFFGLNLFRLDIDAPFQQVFPETMSTQIARDSFWRTGMTLAWNQLLTETVGLSVDYLFARRSGMDAPLRSLLFEDATAEGEEEDHQVRLQLSFVHPAGWLARMRTTFVHQELSSGTRSPGAPENFWLTDVSLTKQFFRRRAALTLAVDNLFDERFQLLSDVLTLRPGETLTGGPEPERRFSVVVTLNF